MVNLINATTLEPKLIESMYTPNAVVKNVGQKSVRLQNNNAIYKIEHK